MTRARENADLPVAMTESGGQVGIGATSVDQLLHLETSTNTRQKIETTNSGAVAGLQLTNTAITAEIGLETSSDAGGGAYSNSIGGSSLHILNNNNSGIVMDTSGRVTTPNSLAVASYLNTTFTHNGGVNKITNWSQSTGSGNVFPAAKHHSSFNYTNSRFVAPVSGLYLMSFKPDYDRTITTGHFISFGINGSNRTFDVLEDLPQYSNSGANYPAYLYLNQNDYVELYSHGGTSYALRGGVGHQYHTWWFIIQLA